MLERDVFQTALSIAGDAARREYLATACAGDEALKRRVEILLHAHEAARLFLEQPIFPGMAGAVTSAEDVEGHAPGGFDRTERLESSGDPDQDDPDDEADDSLDLLQPSTRSGSLGRLAHYEVLEVLGRGGFGTVFKAFDDRLHRMVAIKVMARGLAATSPARKRFLREARAAAAIRHENVVNIYAVDEQPIPYLVMEYVDGRTLQDKLDQSGPIDAAEVLRIGIQLADGLAAAHRQGLIHRDIKPGNILLEEAAERVKITDFGLARAVDDASLTQSGTIAGTPLYMAPEQALGESIDQRADLFSLGSVLYVMCTGRPPFRAPSTLAVLRRVAEDAARPIHEIIPEVPAELCEVINRLHAKDPAARFDSAREVADLLRDQLQTLAERPRVAHSPAAGRRQPAPFDSEFVAPGRFRKRLGGERAGRSWVASLLLGALIASAVVAVLVLAENQLLVRQADRVFKQEEITIVGNDVQVARVDRDDLGALATGVPAPTATDLGPWGRVIDPLGGTRFDWDADRLTIAVPGGSNRHLNPMPWFNLDAPRVLQSPLRRPRSQRTRPEFNVDAPRALQPDAGDFSIQVQVPPFAPPGPADVNKDKNLDGYRWAGLVVWMNERNFLRFGIGKHPEFNAGKPFLDLKTPPRRQDGRRGSALHQRRDHLSASRPAR